LNVNGRACGGIGVGRACCHHAERPITWGVLDRDAIDCDFLHIMTAGLPSHFGKGSPLQIEH
jgi:hypothetical protein